MDKRFRYLPTATSFVEGAAPEQPPEQPEPVAPEQPPEQPEPVAPEQPPEQPEPVGKYPCPCCGYRTLPVPSEEAIAYICPVCFWENDVFLQGDDEPSDENHGLTLQEGRENYRRLGACWERLLPHVRPPRPEEVPN